MKRAILIGLMLLPAAGYIRGQSLAPATLNATGGSKVIGTETYEWSVAEMTMVSTATASNIIVTQGILQPFPLPATDIKKSNTLSKQLQVYPNPTSNIIYLQYNLTNSGTLSYMLQDVAGKQVTTRNAQVTAGQDKQELSLAALASGTYMLYITYMPYNGAAEQANFKIDKISQ